MGYWMGNQPNMDAGFPATADISQGPPAKFNPYKLGGRVPARWTYPYAGYNQPLLELPQNKFTRIALGVNAWLGEPIINSATKLTTSLAFEKMLLSIPPAQWKTMPPWIPEWERAKYIAQFSTPDGGGPDYGNIASAYVKQKCLELAELLDLKTFFEDMALDVLVAGDAYINIVTNATPEEESYVWDGVDKETTIERVKEIQAKMKDDGRGAYQIFALQGLNPSAVWLYPDFAGRITHAKVVHLMGEGVYDINLNNLIHVKSYSFNWTIYGVSHYISAFKWIDIKFKLMDATYVSAKRYVTPREWLTIQGPETPEGGSLPPTEEQMSWADEILSAYNSEVPYVLPAGWEWQLLGAEGKMLKIEGLMEKVDDAIRTASQVSRTFTSGLANVPAYATSKLQCGMMFKAFEPLKKMMSRAIEGRILQRFCLFNGFFDCDGTLLTPKVEFFNLPISGDDSVEKKIAVLGPMGWLSPITAWEQEGIDPHLEMQRINMSRAGLVEPFRAIAPDIGPDQTTDRFMNENEALVDLAKARAKGYGKFQYHLDKMHEAEQSGDISTAETHMRTLGEYLTQAHYLYMSDAKNRLDNALPYEEQIWDQHEALLEKGGRGDRLMKAGAVTAETSIIGN